MTEQSFLPATADSFLKRKEILSGKYKFEQKLETGTSVVNKEFGDFQWDFTSQTGSTSCAPDGCLIEQLGYSSPEKINSRNMNFSRKKIEYQLEITAARLALQIFGKNQNFTSIHIHMDNIVTFTYLKRNGEVVQESESDYTVKRDLGNINFKTNMITLEYLPSSPNKLPELESRRKVDSSEWSSVDMSFTISA